MTTSPAPTTDLTLVLGGTGKTGRRVAERLTARGYDVRIGSRVAQPGFDWDRPETWPPVLAGVRAAYVSYVPDLAFPGAAESVAAFADLAVARGVERLVLLSGRGEDGAERAERAVQESGAHWTIVRSSWFMQNFSEDYLFEPVRSGVLAFPGGDVTEPFIDLEDLADVAASALTDCRHDQQVYEVTGPRLLTFEEAAAEIGAATGRRIDYVPITPDEYAAGAIDAGMPADFAHELTKLLATVLDGRNAHLADGVERALGRAPRDFSEFARDAGRVRCLERIVIDGTRPWLTGAAAVGSGLVAGVFFAFSTFVMAALRRLPPSQGISAMQSINVTVITPLFMLALFGTAVLCAVLAVMALIDSGGVRAGLVLGGAVAYVFGTTVTTIAYHVPRNDALDRVRPSAADAAAKWSTFYTEWTRMNHVRTLSALAACICFVIALRVDCLHVDCLHVD